MNDLLGNCHQSSPLYVSRAAALAAGIPDSIPISTVNRLCSSGLMAIRNIAHAIQSGETSLGVAVGVESMSLKSVVSLLLLADSHVFSPRPTPEVSDIVAQDSQAHDSIQVGDQVLKDMHLT